MANNEPVEVIIGRIDERTKSMKEDINEVKETCKCLTVTVNEHNQQLATIKEKIENSGSPSLSRKQKASVGSVLVAFIVAVVVAIGEYFRH
jgi:hypothetical protein